MSPLVLSLFAILVAVAAKSPLLAPVVLAAPALRSSAHASAEASGNGHANAEASAYADGGNAHADAHAVASSRSAYHHKIILNSHYKKCSSIIEGFVTESISLQPTVKIPPRQNGTSLIYGNDCQKTLGQRHKAGLQVTVCDLGDRNAPVLIPRPNEVVVASSSPRGFIVFSRQFCSRGPL